MIRGLEEEESIIGLGDGFKMVNASVSMILSEIESSGDVWKETTDGGIIDFCVVFSLYLDKQKTTIMYFLETVFHIKVDTRSGFEILNINTFCTEAIEEDKDI